MINLMPPHRIYIETHAGSAAVFRNKKPAQLNIVLERDPDQCNRLRKAFAVQQTKEELLLGEKADYTVQVHNVDALDYLRSLAPDEHTMIYVDPPYLHQTRKDTNLYKYELSEQDHINLLKQLRSMWPCKIMISGYWSMLYDDLLHDWNVYDFETMTRGGLVVEFLWFNYPWPRELHEYTYLGSTFRERERIMRQQNRWISRLHQLPDLERLAMLKRIKEEFL